MEKALKLLKKYHHGHKYSNRSMDEAVTQGGYYTDLTEYFSSVPEIARPFLRNAKVTLSKIEEMLCKGFGRAFGFSRPITRELLGSNL